MVDPERLHRVLRRASDDIGALEAYAARGPDAVLADPAWLGHVKYLFVCVIEGCIDAAQHAAASEGWAAPATNADAIRLLATHGVVEPALAEQVARAVGFRNLLVHQYASIDDRVVVDSLYRLDDLRQYISAVSELAED